MQKPNVTLYLEPKAFLNTVLTEIPTNCILWKWFTGLGATTLELQNWHRSSIIIIPDKSPSLDKMNEMLGDQKRYPYALVVNGDVSNQEIRQYIKETAGDPRKILTTAHSLDRIIEICESAGIDWRNEFFALFDEYHCIITDYSFRDKLYQVASELLVQFSKSALMSATPVQLTDPAFSKYQIYDVKLTKPIIRPINVVITASLFPTAVHFIKEFLGTSRKDEIICIFINCVSAMVDIMHRLTPDQRKLTSLFCADTEANDINLGDFRDNFKKDTSLVTKINMFTQSFNHCWSLPHENPTLVYLTNTNSPYTHQNIKIHGVQSLGRARNEVKQLFHITNTKEFTTIRQSESEIASENMNLANQLKFTSQLDLEYMHYKPYEDQMKYILGREKQVSDYIHFDHSSYKFMVSHGAVGQTTLTEIGNQQYLNQQTIVEAWEDMFYNPTFSYRNDVWSKEEVALAKGKQAKITKTKAVVDSLATLSQAPHGSFHQKEYLKLKSQYPKIDEYVQLIGIEKMAELEYDIPNIKKLVGAKKVEIKLNTTNVKEAIRQRFNVNGLYLRPDTKSILLEELGKVGIKTGITALTLGCFCDIELVPRLPGTPRNKKDNAIKIIAFKDAIQWPSAATG